MSGWNPQGAQAGLYAGYALNPYLALPGMAAGAYSRNKGWMGMQKPIIGAGQGAMQGAASGSAMGPYGALAGGIAGGVAGGAQAYQTQQNQQDAMRAARPHADAAAMAQRGVSWRTMGPGGAAQGAEQQAYGGTLMNEANQRFQMDQQSQQQYMQALMQMAQMYAQYRQMNGSPTGMSAWTNTPQQGGFSGPYGT